MQLRLCHLDLDGVSGTTFAQTLNSFGQLEELDLFSFGLLANTETEFELNLPMLNSIHLERVHVIQTLTLDAPRLQKVKLEDSSPLSLVIVHGESVERLLTDRLKRTAVKNLKNLKYLHIGYSDIDSTLLSDLQQLKAIHLDDEDGVYELFEQKQRYDRTDLLLLWPSSGWSR